MKLYILIAAVLFSASVVSAQEQPVTAEAVFLSAAQPTVQRLPLPEYPENAKLAGLGGRVSVAVTVDESGNVTSVDDATGPYPVCNSVTEPKVLALRAAAIKAAKKTTFKPAMGEQGAIKVTGRIAYVFTPIGNKPEPQNILTVVGAVEDDKSPSKESKPKEIRQDRLTMIGNADVATTTTMNPNNKPGGVDSDTGYKRVETMRLDPNYKSPSVDSGATTPVKIGSAESKSVSGGVLNGKASSLPKPIYPAAAKAVRAGGAVTVRVVIFEDGSMYSAQAVSGHPLLRHASETAACSSGFTPTLLQGNPVKVMGVITYNFVP